VRVLLVNPPRSPHNAILAHAPQHARRYIHKKLIGPPLGLLTIAAALRAHDVEILEMKGEYDLLPDSPPPGDLVARAIEKHRPAVVGITVISSEFPASMEILRAVRAADPAVVTVAGGLHTTLCPRDFARAEIDVICPGQSARAFAELVDAIEEKRPQESVDGIYVNGAQGLRFTRLRIGDPDPAGEGFLMPDRGRLRRWISTYRVGGSPNPVTYLFTSLGCPYRCSFCSIWPQFDGRYHQRRVESIIDELRGIDDYPIVRFADANTVVNVRFMEELLDRIEQENIRKEYVMDLRADTAASHPRLIERLAKAGLKVVICGFESFRNADLERYHKSADAALNAKAIEVLHANGISIRGNYVIPPDYGPDDFAALAEYASSHRVTFAGYTILTPMPGTQLFYDSVYDIVDFDLAKYNFFNCVLRTRLPLERFYESMASLWPIKMGDEVI
jgi:hopanoid C-3 methylase